jgi:hypothetical protein
MERTAVTRRDAIKGAAALASDAQAEAPQSIPDSGASVARTVSGIVYECTTGEPRRPGDSGVAGVLVSNGREVVRTDAQGQYTLPIDDEAVIFLIKPSSYSVPTQPSITTLMSRAAANITITF